MKLFLASLLVALPAVAVAQYQYSYPYHLNSPHWETKDKVPLNSGSLYNYYGIGDAARAAAASEFKNQDPYSGTVTSSATFENVACADGTFTSGTLSLTSSGISGFSDESSGFDILTSMVKQNGPPLSWKDGKTAVLKVTEAEVMMVVDFGTTTLTADMSAQDVTLCGAYLGDVGGATGTITLTGVQLVITADIAFKNNLETGGLSMWRFDPSSITATFDTATTDIDNTLINTGIQAFTGEANLEAHLNGSGAVEIEADIVEAMKDAIALGVPMKIEDYYFHSEDVTYGWFTPGFE